MQTQAKIDASPNRKNHALATARKRLELSQAQLAQKAGVSKRSIESYERFERIPSPPVAERLALILGLTIEEMWDVFYRPNVSESRDAEPAQNQEPKNVPIATIELVDRLIKAIVGLTDAVQALKVELEAPDCVMNGQKSDRPKKVDLYEHPDELPMTYEEYLASIGSD